MILLLIVDGIEVQLLDIGTFALGSPLRSCSTGGFYDDFGISRPGFAWDTSSWFKLILSLTAWAWRRYLGYFFG